MFPEVKTLNRKNFECPKVEDSGGNLITNPNGILRTGTFADYFENKFKDSDISELTPFTWNQKPLNQPITQAEIRTNFKGFRDKKITWSRPNIPGATTIFYTLPRSDDRNHIVTVLLLWHKSDSCQRLCQ